MKNQEQKTVVTEWRELLEGFARECSHCQKAPANLEIFGDWESVFCWACFEKQLMQRGRVYMPKTLRFALLSVCLDRAVLAAREGGEVLNKKLKTSKQLVNKSVRNQQQ